MKYQIQCFSFSSCIVYFNVSIDICCSCFRIDRYPLSFNKFSRSAPHQPSVSLAINSISPSSSLQGIDLFRINVLIIPLLSYSEGGGTNIFRSNLPGRSKAGSTREILLVAPMINILLFWVNPSISVRSWFMVDLCYFVCQCSERDPIASISSIKIMAPFSIFLAFSKMSLIRFGPTPTKIS